MTDFDRRRTQQNRLLILLREIDGERLDRNLELLTAPQDLVLCEQGDKLDHFYFPVDCIISLVHDMADGASSEVAIVGNEGMVDVAEIVGESATKRTVVKRAGTLYRLPAEVLRRAFDRNDNVQRLLLKYFRALLMQIAQTAACNRHHTIEQQLCRLLLSNLDRMRATTLNMTHEVVAAMLGVRREGVTAAIGRLKQADLIRGERGIISILDRRGLERRCCECYSAVRREYDLLRPDAAEAGGTGFEAGVNGHRRVRGNGANPFAANGAFRRVDAPR